MQRQFLLAGVLLGLASLAFGMGRKNGDARDIQPVQRGSAANPNSAYSAPSWSYTPPPSTDPTASEHHHTKTAAPKKPVADSPAPAAEAFPDYTAPQTPKTGQPLAKDSIEPPLPDEPGGNLDKKPSFK